MPHDDPTAPSALVHATPPVETHPKPKATGPSSIAPPPPWQPALRRTVQTFGDVREPEAAKRETCARRLAELQASRLPNTDVAQARASVRAAPIRPRRVESAHLGHLGLAPSSMMGARWPWRGEGDRASRLALALASHRRPRKGASERHPPPSDGRRAGVERRTVWLRCQCQCWLRRRRRPAPPSAARRRAEVAQLLRASRRRAAHHFDIEAARDARSADACPPLRRAPPPARARKPHGALRASFSHF